MAIGAACGSGSSGRGEGARIDPETSEQSSPFTVGQVPEGYELVVAGTGTARQRWGSDISGTDEPFTVLAPPGEGADSTDVVVVSVTGFEGYQGGLNQASAGYSNEDESFTLDGKEAVYAPAGTVRGKRRGWRPALATHRCQSPRPACGWRCSTPQAGSCAACADPTPAALGRLRAMDLDVARQFLRDHHRGVLVARRSDGAPQLSPVVAALDDQGRVAISSRETAYKVKNLLRDPAASYCGFSDAFFGEWVQVDGTATIIQLPDAMDGLVDLYRRIAGEHEDWDDYRAGMEREQRVIIAVDIERAGPDRSG